ncbi:hypothetical protein [Aurantimonas sp. Leaf443]|uniref:hypothetical protein n=1 Tax=Aurantimonas sp. Leaf443 TaxID=1736378 RepID=UPI0006F49FEE|nr:hypothetical protein [Aurantimonas sp. Leaf443]KQT83140.1 hypothetical protein ASG48_14320 [Aurantimonas sp. Leaf443]
MSPRSLLMESIAVLCGAAIGLLVVNALHWLFADGDFFALTVSLGRAALAIVTVALYAVWYRLLPQTPAALAAFFTGVLLPTVIVLFSYDVPLATTTVLLLYTAFSVVSLLTYRFVLSNAAVREAVSEAAPGGGGSFPPQ